MDTLKKIGLKMTPQRSAILDYLKGNTAHPSAEDVYNAVSKNFPSISFATVYNTLEMLRRNGKVLELTIDPQKKRFDPNTEAHHHMICVKCKKIVDIHTKYELEVADTMKSGFEITGNHIEFYGVCPECGTK